MTEANKLLIVDDNEEIISVFYEFLVINNHIEKVLLEIEEYIMSGNDSGIKQNLLFIFPQTSFILYRCVLCF